MGTVFQFPAKHQLSLSNPRISSQALIKMEPWWSTVHIKARAREKLGRKGSIVIIGSCCRMLPGELHLLLGKLLTFNLCLT